MKRHLKRQYIWTDLDLSFNPTPGFALDSCLFLSQINEVYRYTTHDYAVDIRAAQSLLIQELYEA